MSDILPQMLPPAGSRLVIAGGCGGIGRVLVDRAVAAGIEVTVLDLPAAIATNPRSDIRQIGLDLGDETKVNEAFAAIAAQGDAIDGFVSLAGFSNDPAPLAEMSIDRWDDAIAGNLRSAYLACRAALPLLRRAPGSAIVLVSSGQGVRPIAGFGPYGAAKAGLISLGRSLALENAPDIRVNIVAPGAVRTAFLTGGTARAQRPGEDIDSKADRYASAIPMGRIAEPVDVVDPILFLLGPGARFITGQLLHINGGGLMA